MRTKEQARNYKEEVLRKRIKLFNDAENNAALQEQLFNNCKNDYQFWYDNYVYVFNPKADKGLRRIAAVMDEFQIDLKKDIDFSVDNKLDRLVEKSREMRVTWDLMAQCLYDVMFEEETSILVGSRKQDLVDKSDKDDTLFWKIDYIYKNLPSWMRQRAILLRSRLLITNPSLGSTIIGESANDDFGRGGRYKKVIMDEFASWEHGEAAWEACSESTNTRICVSTPKGKSNKFYRIRKEGKTPITNLHWSKDPEKDQDWYLGKKAKFTDEEIAQELDIDYEKSQIGLVYKSWYELVTFGSYKYNPKLPLYVSWDFGEGGSDDTALIWYQKDFETESVYMIDCVAKNFKDPRWFSAFITGKITSERGYTYSNKELDKIAEHEKWKGAIHFGDPYDGNKKMLTTTIVQELRKDHIYINMKRDSRVQDRITKGRLLLKRLFVDEENAIEASDLIAQARYPQVQENSQGTSEKTLPVHDETAHYRTSYEYFADNEPMRDIDKKPKPTVVRRKFKKTFTVVNR